MDKATLQSSLDRAVSVADVALRFGRVERATFHHDGLRPETDTDHTVALGLLAIELAVLWGNPNGVSPGTVALLSLVHDLVEAECGDTNTLEGLTPEGQAAKAQREAAALETLRKRFGSDFAGDSLIIDAIEIYEAQVLPDARFVRYLDKVTPKLSHILNGAACVRRQGRTVAWLHACHEEQGAQLRAAYPEWASTVGELFDAAARAAEQAMAARGPRG